MQEGLLAEWRFDDGSGTQLTDYSGNDSHGTLGSAGAAPTWVSTGLSFDGGDHVRVSPAPAPSGNNITVWVVAKIPAGGSDAFFACAGDLQSGVDTCAWLMALGDSGNDFRVDVTDNGDQDDPAHWQTRSESTQGPYDDDTWMALAFTFDGTTILPYVNGALETFDGGGGTTNGLYSTAADLIIGALLANNAALAPFTGSMAYMTINEIVMDSDQIAAQYAALQSILAARSITLP